MEKLETSYPASAVSTSEPSIAALRLKVRSRMKRSSGSAAVSGQIADLVDLPESRGLPSQRRECLSCHDSIAGRVLVVGAPKCKKSSIVSKGVRELYEESFLRRAIALSAKAVDLPGTEPFAAVIVQNGLIVGEGINRSREKFDPTSHGETEAIRDACRKLETVDLRGCDLYSSCEPCALCVAAMQIVGVSRLYYAAGLVESNAVLKDVPPRNRFVGIDATTLREECGKAVDERSMPARQALSEEALAVVADWANQFD